MLDQDFIVYMSVKGSGVKGHFPDIYGQKQ